ncbi:GNAT family N-acetyltransferase [Pseudoalteromonas sp. T1lg76]|uniref:GNAT family N-acetyltransferase n=1 Tax=Pseudoalteromonas sp. T1lg76 TaxID=2077103 RepID=UPI000CF61DB7|nr:GNAT family N-acetyltransferase [Pseudoalteromonas sp. T1lg76]
MHIELATAPSEADLKTISQGIQSYNQEHLPKQVVFEPDTRFAAFARNDKGEVIGGIRAKAFWNYCIIELLWLSAQTRGSGVGSRLMAAVEAHAKAQGFNYMRTETLDFQAKPFYEKLGYQVYGELVDCPKGHTTYCLIKAL